MARNPRQNLLRLLSKGVIIGDGAMGTELYAKGVFVNTCFDELNLSRPDLVRQVHDGYVAAGADFLETNTFGANRLRLSAFALADETEKINRTAVQIASESAAGKVLIAGAVGPAGTDIATDDDKRVKIIEAAFAEQIKTLAESGADFILLETFENLSELLCAVRAAAENCSLPIVAQLTVNENHKTKFGDRLDESIIRLCRFEQIAAAGINCSLGPAAMLNSLDIIKRVSTKPISVQPNAGMPKTVDGRTMYMCTPEYMAEYAKRFYEKGAGIIGGCCGCGPQHIAEIAKAVKGLDKAAAAGRPVKIEMIPRQKPARRQQPDDLADKSALGAKIAAGKKVLTIEISPPKGADVSGIIEKAKICADAGADAVNIPDGPRASSRISALITAIKIEQSCNIETILHYCCRDRNIIAMQSDLLGIHTVGLRNLLIITGDPPKLGEYPDATGVFDMDSVALTKVVSDLNCGIDIAGNGFDTKTSLAAGVGVNPVAADMERELSRFREKVAGGAEFAITQPVFDPESFEKFIEAIKDFSIPIIAGIWPFTSYKNAEFMANEVPGVVVPKKILAQMAEAQSAAEAKQTGIEIAQRLMEKIESCTAGFAVSAPFGNVKMALAAAGRIDIDKI